MNAYGPMINGPNEKNNSPETTMKIKQCKKLNQVMRANLEPSLPRWNDDPILEPMTFIPMRFENGRDEHKEKKEWKNRGSAIRREFITLTYPQSLKGTSAVLQIWMTKEYIETSWGYCQTSWNQIWNSSYLNDIDKIIGIDNGNIYLKRDCEWGRQIWKFQDERQILLLVHGTTWVINMDQYPDHFYVDGSSQIDQFINFIKAKSMDEIIFEFANTTLSVTNLLYSVEKDGDNEESELKVFDKPIEVKIRSPHSDFERVSIKLGKDDKKEILHRYMDLETDCDTRETVGDSLGKWKENKSIRSLSQEFEELEKKVMEKYNEGQEEMYDMEDGKLAPVSVKMHVSSMCDGPRPFTKQDVEARATLVAWKNKWKKEGAITREDKHIYAVIQLEVSMGATSNSMVRDDLYPSPYVTWTADRELKLLSQSEPHKQWVGESAAMEFMDADPYNNRIIPSFMYHYELLSQIEAKVEHIKGYALPFDIDWKDGKIILRDMYVTDKVLSALNYSYDDLGERLQQIHGAFDWTHGSFTTELAELEPERWEEHFESEEIAKRHIIEETVFIDQGLCQIKFQDDQKVNGGPIPCLARSSRLILDMKLSEERIRAGTKHSPYRGPSKSRPTAGGYKRRGRARAREIERDQEREYESTNSSRSRSRSREERRSTLADENVEETDDEMVEMNEMDHEMNEMDEQSVFMDNRLIENDSRLQNEIDFVIEIKEKDED